MVNGNTKRIRYAQICRQSCLYASRFDFGYLFLINTCFFCKLILCHTVPFAKAADVFPQQFVKIFRAEKTILVHYDHLAFILVQDHVHGNFLQGIFLWLSRDIAC